MEQDDDDDDDDDDDVKPTSPSTCKPISVLHIFPYVVCFGVALVVPVVVVSMNVLFASRTNKHWCPDFSMLAR